MGRLDKTAILASLTERVGATPDPEGLADLTSTKGRIVVVASPGDVDAALLRLKTVPGYRWVAINSGDLFGVSPKTLGSKVGIMDVTGKVLKAADLPRPK